jgi:hypothetical protein
MKKVYSAPQLIVHGTVEELTKAMGTSGRDTLFFGGGPIGTGTGSTDYDVSNPTPR